MKICFHAGSGDLSDALRRTVQQALAQPVVDLAASPLHTWKESIAAADLLVIDSTGANANASYLVGLADAFAKRAILLAPIEESLPRIFENRTTIIHRWNFDLLKSELQKIVGGSLFEQHAQSDITDDSPAGKFQRHFGDLLRAHGYVHRGPVEFDGATFTLREQDMDLPLVQEISRRAKSLNLRVRLL